MQSRKNTREPMPSSSDLASLVLCETKALHEQRGGTRCMDRQSRQAVDDGLRGHARAQQQMEAFHNRPRQPAMPAADFGPAPRSQKDSRCFIASEVYGPSAPETDELRDVRDRHLVGSPLGRGLVRSYYRLSPPVARWLAGHPGAAAMTRSALDAARWALRRLSA